jgi:hypothetical protein
LPGCESGSNTDIFDLFVDFNAQLPVIDTMQLVGSRMLQCNMFSIKRKSLPHFAEAELAQAKHSDLSPFHDTLGDVRGEAVFDLSRPGKYSKDF